MFFLIRPFISLAVFRQKNDWCQFNYFSYNKKPKDDTSFWNIIVCGGQATGLCDVLRLMMTSQIWLNKQKESIPEIDPYLIKLQFEDLKVGYGFINR